MTRKRKTSTILGTLKNNLAKNRDGKRTIKTSQNYNNYPIRGGVRRGARIKPFTTTKIEYIWFGPKKQKNKPKKKKEKEKRNKYFFLNYEFVEF